MRIQKRSGNVQKIAEIVPMQFQQAATTNAKAAEISTPKVVKAIYPSINTKATRLTMDAYRLFVDNYNRHIAEINKAIQKYNDFIQEEPESKIEADSRYLFMRTHGNWRSVNGTQVWYRSQKYSREEYNELAKEHNDFWNKKTFRLEEIQPIRSSSEAIFRQILYVYMLQLLKSTSALQKFKIQAKTEIDSVIINSAVIANAQRNGIGVLNYCTKTIRNHCKRLEEAGILINRRFISAIKGVSFDIAPEILYIFDQKTQKILTTENQAFTGGSGKKLPYIYYELQELLNKKEIKENVDNNSLGKEFATAHECLTPEVSGENKEFAIAHDSKNLQEQTLQEHRWQCDEFGKTRGGAPPKFEQSLPKKEQKSTRKRKITPEIGKLSQMLTARIEPIPQFCRDLAAGNYDNYKSLDIRILDREAYSGIISREDFHDLIIQEFLKQSAKIWKGKNATVGTWMNTYKLLKSSYFVGLHYKPLHKNYQVELLGEYRWRIEHARKYFLRHKDFNPLYPSQYFDRTRTTNQEGGFEYTKKAWQKHLKYTQERDVRKHSAERKSQLRKDKINAHKAVTLEIKKYIADKCTITELYHFVSSKYPEYVEHISDMMTNLIT